MPGYVAIKHALKNMSFLKNPEVEELKTNVKTDVEIEADRLSNLNQLIIDWVRIRNIIFINGESLGDIFKAKGITADAYAEHGGFDREDPVLLGNFKKILLDLIPPAERHHDVEKTYQQIALLLHQGGLFSSLEAQIARTLTENGRMFDSAKSGMRRGVFLETTDSGFTIKEIFTYTGNISKRNPDEPEFLPKGVRPLLTGKCEYNVTVKGANVIPSFNGMLISSDEPALEVILQAGDAAATAEMMREGLLAIKGGAGGASCSSEITEEDDDIRPLE
jgi:hypothetical protein